MDSENNEPDIRPSFEGGELDAALKRLEHLVNSEATNDPQVESHTQTQPQEGVEAQAAARMPLPIASATTPASTPRLTQEDREPEEHQPTVVNARLESRTHVATPKRRQFWQNFQSQRQENRLETALDQSAFSQSLRGKLMSLPLTSWLFHRQSRRLDVLTLVSVLAVATAVIWSFNFSNNEADPVINIETATPITSDGQVLLIGKEESEEVVRQFFAADSIDQVASMIRHPDIIKPLMDRWYVKHPMVAMTKLEFGESRIKEFGQSTYYLHYVLLPDEVDPRPVAIEDTAEGYKVDWETAVGYQAMDWDELKKAKPQETVYMRVVATSDNYHNFQFIDDQVWVCRRLSHPKADSVLYGYTKRNSKIDQSFNSTLKDKDQKADYFILGIRYPEDPQSDNVVLIDEVLQSKWVIDYQDGQEHFDLSPVSLN